MTRTSTSAAVGVIAAEQLGLRTLHIRGRDDLDFHDLHVGRIERALTRAYRDDGVAAVNRIFTTNQEADQT